jgi:hypothetical protein
MSRGDTVRTAKILLLALAVGVPVWAAAQPATQPEVLTGTAQIKNATGAVSGTLEVRLRRVTPEFDRKTVETALKEGGYPRFLTAIRNAPEVGQLLLGGGAPFAIRYARERVDATGRRLVLVTDKPVYFVGGGRSDADIAARKGFEVAVIELRLDDKGVGTGSMAAAARVRPDGDGGVLLDDFAEQLITVSNIARKPS